jgi:antitoxin component of MazEF toxin-antitoxin module
MPRLRDAKNDAVGNIQLPSFLEADIIKYNKRSSMTVTIKKIGGSVAVVIPMAMARELALTAGTPLEITSSDGGIVPRKRRGRPRRPLSEIVAQIKPGSYDLRRQEFSRDKPVGKEIW